jgi:hypothetical protein
MNYSLIGMTDILATGQSLRLKNAQCSGEEICLNLQVERGNSMVGPLKTANLEHWTQDKD